jgi:hypothetical protein
VDTEVQRLLVLLVMAVAPVTLVLVVALLRGYTIRFVPPPGKRHHQDVDDGNGNGRG